jgi:hypothetical protein
LGHSNTAFQVVLRCGKLALDVPSELVFELREPGKEARWQFVRTSAIAISFKNDSGGKVLALVVHQSGMSFELPRDKPVHDERTKK